MLRSVVVIPSTPLTLPGHPGRPHAEILMLQDQIGRAIRELTDTDLVVAVAGGPEAAGLSATVGTPSNLSESVRAGYGVATPSGSQAPRTTTIEGTPATADAGRRADADGDARATAAALIRAGAATTPAAPPIDGGQTPAPVAADAWADGAVLIAHLGTAAPGVTVLQVSVPPSVNTALTTRVAGLITDLADRHATALIVAGDLSAGHGNKPPRPGAPIGLDDHVLGALDAGQPERLLRIDDDVAAQSGSRAVGALRVLGAILTESTMGTVVRWRGAPLGVGYVVAVGR